MISRSSSLRMASKGKAGEAAMGSSSHHEEGGMDYERWVNQHMDLLKMKSMTGDVSLRGVPLPKRLSEKIFKVSVDERNSKGETLMISVIRYVCDELKQVQFLNILIRMGANPNLGDTKNQRTPLMYAALYRQSAAVRVLVNHPQLHLGLKDRLGNTALMYAALQGDKTIIDLLAIRLAKSWSFDVFLNKNRKGSTAENMAVSNQNSGCADILKSTRIRMLQRMHKQLALINYSAELRGWKGYTSAFRAARIWQTKRHRRRMTASMPILNDLDETWNSLHLPDQRGHREHMDDHLHPYYKPRAKSCMVFRSHEIPQLPNVVD